MDASSELIHSLLPIFLTTTLGASMTTLGILEGVAGATVSITKVFSGTLSDYLRKRKALLVTGYGLAMLTKPVIPAAHTIAWVFGAHIVDRIGKGIRGAPRDALVADITPSALRGAAYGLREALDTVGAVIGPLLAFVLMIVFAGNIRSAMWIAVVPAFICVAILVLWLREPEIAQECRDARKPLSFAEVKQFSSRYWFIVLLGAVFTLARFSEAFLVLRAQSVGLPLPEVPLVLVVMSLFYAAFAFPAGAASDHLDTRWLLLAGITLLVIADLVLARATSAYSVLAGAAVWGLHMACTQGLFSRLVADTAPSSLRGTAFGIFNLVSGCALLLASTIAGLLWSTFGATATFLAGAGFATLAALGLLAYRNH